MEITNIDVNQTGFGATGCNLALRFRAYFFNFYTKGFCVFNYLIRLTNI